MGVASFPNGGEDFGWVVRKKEKKKDEMWSRPISQRNCAYYAFNAELRNEVNRSTVGMVQ
jgi:hypothetical protein